MSDIRDYFDFPTLAQVDELAGIREAERIYAEACGEPSPPTTKVPIKYELNEIMRGYIEDVLGEQKPKRKTATGAQLRQEYAKYSWREKAGTLTYTDFDEAKEAWLNDRRESK